MAIAGYRVGDNNFRLRFFVIIFMGITALGAVLYWRSQLFMSSDFVDVPMASHLQKNRANLYNQYDIDK